jgi:hypothetical protein
MEKTIDLLECLHSPFPTDLFNYLDILQKLKSEMSEVAVQVTIVKHALNRDSIPIRSFYEFPARINQPG